MVLFNENVHVDFPHYGIEIPSLPTRGINTLNALKNDPELGPRASEWLLEEIPQVIDRSDLLRAHTEEYVNGLYSGRLEELLMAAYELIGEDGSYHRYNPANAKAPLTDLLDDVLHVISGTYRCIETALAGNFCYAMSGGMHHAHPGFGHGFCVLNDVSVALLKAQAEGLIRTAWIIDVDAHRGDGTAEIMSKNENITALSIHMASGWPLDVPEFSADGSRNPGWFPGDIDIPIESGEEAEYTPRLIAAMEQLEKEKGLPDLVFVVAGVDPFEGDELASSDPINLTRAQMLERDQALYRFVQDRSLPSAWVAAGGYGRTSWEIHTAFLAWVLKERLARTARR